MRMPILQLSCRLFWQNIPSPRSVSTPTAQVWLPATSGFPKAKIDVENAEICECDGHTVDKPSQQNSCSCSWSRTMRQRRWWFIDGLAAVTIHIYRNY